MPDWKKSMQQTYEYYIVDPGTWKDSKQLRTVKSCSVNRDMEVDTLGSATIDATESIGECYIRVYLVTIQNGITEKHPLGTVLVQTPASDFNGKIRTASMDSYTPLLELKDNYPPLGYSVLKDANIMDTAYRIVRDNVRAPVVPATCDTVIHSDFVASPENNWLIFLSEFIANAKYSFALDEMGRILFSPNQDTASLQPVWTYDDGNSSILYPEISLNQDLFGIPNVVEVTYSDEKNTYFARVVNDDSNSPISTVNRGREIPYRESNPNLSGIPTQEMVEEYARQLLRSKSVVAYTLSYTHAYCGTRLGDCVRLDYKRAGLVDIKARIVSQSIECKPGCPVTEKAIFTTKLWGG